MSDIASLERRIRSVELALILLSIAAVAAADRFLAPAASLGFLYLVPLSYAALTRTPATPRCCACARTVASSG